jgi:hypothetical protein
MEAEVMATMQLVMYQGTEAVCVVAWSAHAMVAL